MKRTGKRWDSAESKRAPRSSRTGAVRRHRILLVDDHVVVSNALAQLLNHEHDLEVCGVADDSTTALAKIALLKPDLVVLDLTLKSGSGLELLKHIKTQDRDQRVLVLSMHDETLYAPRALRGGACGYVMKEAATDVVFAALRQVLAGGTYVSPRLENKLLQRYLTGKAGTAMDPRETLTPREVEVFRLIGQRKSIRDIARDLSLSVKTVECHRNHIKEKLGLKTAADLMRQALELEQSQ